jgi:hypothetical protein
MLKGGGRFRRFDFICFRPKRMISQRTNMSPAAQDSLDNYALAILSQLADIKATVSSLVDFQKDLAVRTGLERQYVDSFIEERRQRYEKDYTSKIQASLAEGP